MDIIKLIDTKKIVTWRRHLHMYPEIGFKEHETTKYIVGELAKYPEIEVLRPTETGCVAVLKGVKSGKVVGLRADIDALPLEEQADVEFKSKNPGVMHACGHDMHAAMLLGAVDALYKIKDALCGTVKFIFQHAEEVDPGGAVQIIESGALDDVQAFYGCHVASDTPVGTVLAAHGPVYANADFFAITVQGKGSHAARPENSIDPLLTGAEIVQALNHIVSRNIATSESAVVTVGMFHAGTADNIIPDIAKIAGTVRSYTPEVRDLAEERIKTVAQGICSAYGAKCVVDYIRGYSAVVNDEALYHLFKKITAETLPDVIIEEMEPIMGAEDFSAYSTIAPAFYSCVGAKPDGEEYFEHHHPKFKLDEDALVIGTALHIAFALRV